MSYFKKRSNAFGYAFSGIWQSLKAEAHLKIMLLATAAVVIEGFYFKVSRIEWMILVICCGFVMSLELANSAVEKLCDTITTEKSPKIKYIKDVMAGAVLVASVSALIIGLIIFYPYIIQMLS